MHKHIYVGQAHIAHIHAFKIIKQQTYVVINIYYLYIYIYICFFLQGLRGNVTDACERHDPCQHGGICISTDSGPLCECRNLEYEGTYCERGKINKSKMK